MIEELRPPDDDPDGVIIISNNIQYNNPSVLRDRVTNGRRLPTFEYYLYLKF